MIEVSYVLSSTTISPRTTRLCHFCSIRGFAHLHTSLETWFWFQWNLTIPYDQGWWERQYEVYLKQFYCKNPDLCFSQDFKRVLWKYKISSYTTAFYFIFWFFGTYYDDQSHFCGLKCSFLPKIFSQKSIFWCTLKNGKIELLEVKYQKIFALPLLRQLWRKFWDQK